MSQARLPAHLEVAALIRSAQADGGFATVIAKGERDAGVILLLTMEKGENARVWERMPNLNGSRVFQIIHDQTTENKESIPAYLARRAARDPDCWIIELDVADSERFVAALAS